ncbi:MAG: hypothetical protein RO257_05745 [Candidatus Kapabacteria bacterium]|jgi:hypothetical protein|nr:hypothetical protein [Candidatus Kapabacteria bacterium]
MAIVATRKRSRRAKYITLYSPFLMKETKHELIGEPIETETGRHQWARCTKSRHSQLVNLDAIEVDSDKSKAVVHISREDARKYSPKDEYNIGDVIFHSVWDDVGIVRSKEVTSNGGHAIIVQFEKNNEKKLIENLSN